MKHLLTSCALGLLATTAQAAQDQPNIVFFYTDDLGYGDLGSFWQDQKTSGKSFDTPGLDRMAAEGVKLTHHYTAAPVCAPARASLMQGRHQGHADVRDNSFDEALPDNHTMATVLRAAGYRTVHVGKAGLAGSESGNLSGNGSQNLPAHPLDRGFDHFFGYLFHADGHEHYPRNGNTDKRAYIYDGYRQVTDASEDLYTTDAWTAYAKKEIIEEANDGDDQPFFVYLAYDTPHFKMQRPAVAYPGEDVQNGNHDYGLNGGVQWTTATDGSGKVRYASTATGQGTPDAYTHPSISSSWSNAEKQHVGMIRRIDNSVADILQLLEDLGIDENTICVFSSDNGPHDEGNDPRSFESYADMEGIKRDLWEAGMRMPTIVRWPSHLPQATNDENNIAEIAQPSAIWDWMPTFADLAGVVPPAWCDGVSLAPTLTGSGGQQPRDYLYFEYYHPGSTPNWSVFSNHRGTSRHQMQAIRIGDFMGVRTNIQSIHQDFEIYDVVHDPDQGVNLASTHASLQQQMKDLALQARRPEVSRWYIDDENVPPVTNPAEGSLQYTVHEGDWQWVPEMRGLAADASGEVDNFDLSVRTRDDNVGILFSGHIYAPEDGSYTFYLESDSGADLFLHDAHVIDDDYTHDGSERSASIRLAQGWHPIRLYYVHMTGAHELSLEWSGPSMSRQSISDQSLAVPDSDPEPTANDDEASVPGGSSVNINVLANDFDDGQPDPPGQLSIESVGTPRHGTASISGSEVIYTPEAGFFGDDRFSYTVSDSVNSTTGWVNVQVYYQDPERLWLPFDEGEGAKVATAAGAPIGQLTDFGGSDAGWTLGHSGNALEFDGVESRVELDASYAPPSGSDSRTVTAWVKATGTGAIVAWGQKSAQQKWYIRVEDADGSRYGAVRVEVEGGYRTGSINVLDDQWHHVAVVLPQGASNVDECLIYVDGVEDGSYDTSSQTINTASTSVQIGTDQHPTPRFFAGVIDEVRIYRRALTAQEIAEQAAEGSLVYPLWHVRNYGPAEIDWNADDDGDGLTRLGELAYAGDPHGADGAGTVPTGSFNAESGRLEISFRRRTDDLYPLNYVVETSGDLANWSASGVTEISAEDVANAESLEQVLYETNATLGAASAQFLRVRIEQD